MKKGRRGRVGRRHELYKTGRIGPHSVHLAITTHGMRMSESRKFAIANKLAAGGTVEPVPGFRMVPSGKRFRVYDERGGRKATRA